ncbi:Rieske 2Fe-2S domain-containing protein [Kocuria sp. NPDC057446]|uniref:Rieske 2Fe-2S domain-containing protein n=1 Tax=Kocuria sp. NPDC057446 TaxID=3346137 RepID=UPI0036B621DB
MSAPGDSAEGWERIVAVSAVPDPFDFVTVPAATGPVLVTRAADGALHVLRNTCTHQQATVCRESSGHTETFECPNHFWVFAPDGRFVGSRLALAAGREAPPDPAKNLRAAEVGVVDGWVVARFG